MSRISQTGSTGVFRVQTIPTPRKTMSVQKTAPVTRPAVPASASAINSTIPKEQPYFSSLSTRAKIDRFFRGKGTQQKTLVFDFVQAPGMSGVKKPATTHTALQIQHSRVKAENNAAKAPKFGKAAKKASESRNDRPQSRVRMERVDYQPVLDGEVLTEALKLDFSRKTLKAVAAPEPNIMILPDGQVLTRDQFKARQVTRQERPWVKNMLTTLRQVLPESLSRVVHIQENGTVHLFSKWVFNPSEYWVDQDQQKLKPYHLDRLGNGIIADVKKRTDLGTFTGHHLKDPALRKIVRENILNQMERIETGGYMLKLEPVTSPPTAMTGADIARALKEKGHKPNPFSSASGSS